MTDESKGKVASEFYSASEAAKRREQARKCNYELMSDYGFYDAILAGSIDGTLSADDKPHDRALLRAVHASYAPSKEASKMSVERTLFVGRLSYATGEGELRDAFARYGSVRRVRIVRDLVTGHSVSSCCVT